MDSGFNPGAGADGPVRYILLQSDGIVLDQRLTTTGGWSQVTFPYNTNANVFSVSTPGPTGNKFCRLRKL